MMTNTATAPRVDVAGSTTGLEPPHGADESTGAADGHEDDSLVDSASLQTLGPSSEVRAPNPETPTTHVVPTELELDLDRDLDDLDSPESVDAGSDTAVAIQSFIRSPFADTGAIPSDPLLFLLQLGSAIARSESAHAAASVDEASTSQELANDQIRDAHRRAAAASRRARRLLRHAPPWVKKLVKVLTVAIGVAAAAFTGGASLGLAIAGAVLMLGAKGFERLAVELGMDPAKARWIGVACGVAGGALMAGSGIASSAANTATSAASATSSTVEAASATASSVATATTAATSAAEAGTATIAQIRQLVTLFESAMTAVEGGRTVGGSVLLHRVDEATLDAMRLGNDRDRIADATAAIVEEMARTLASYRDTETRTLDILELEHRRDDAILSRIGR